MATEESAIAPGDVPSSVRHYDVGSYIGSGISGVVVRARNRMTGDEVAIKFVSRRKLADLATLAAFEQELRIHQTLHHRSIVEIIEVIYEEDWVCVVLELCTHGDLLGYIESPEVLPAVQILSYFAQILVAVDYLHSRGIAHLDIKPENILIAGDKIVKLTDFGCSENGRRENGPWGGGTLMYSAPELLRGYRADNRPADIWSLGILIFALFMKVLPFQAGADEDERISYDLLIPPRTPGYVEAIVRDCCKMDPTERPTVHYLMTLPTLQAEVRHWRTPTAADSRDALAHEIVRPSVRSVQSSFRLTKGMNTKSAGGLTHLDRIKIASSSVDRDKLRMIRKSMLYTPKDFV
jgi:serine/threonine protein kinase